MSDEPMSPEQIEAHKRRGHMSAMHFNACHICNPRQRPANRNVPARITEYLSNGGLFNPEAMDHEAVRDLLIDARDVIEIMERERA